MPEENPYSGAWWNLGWFIFEMLLLCVIIISIYKYVQKKK